MALKSLNQLRGFRELLIRLRIHWYRRVVGVDIDPSLKLSLSSRILPGRRGSVSVGRDTLISFKTLIYSQDPQTGEDRPVRIGSRCFIGGGAVVLPGVTIGDGCIVGAGAVVFDSLPPGSIAAGNPARVLRHDDTIGPFGRLPGADDNSRRLWS